MSPNEIITLKDQYSQIIQKGAEEIGSLEGQLHMAAWVGMKSIYSTCEEARALLERAGSIPSLELDSGEIPSLSQTYADLAETAKKSVSSIKNSYFWYKNTKEILGWDDSRLTTLSIPPTNAGEIVRNKDLTKAQKQELLKKAEEAGLTNGQIKKEIILITGKIKDAIKIMHSTYWKFAKPAPEFGQVYPSRLPGQLIYNLLHHYTDEDSLCLFPFVGGGTEADVAKSMERDYYAWDINKLPELEKEHGERYFSANSLQPWEITEVLDEKADFIFADPPKFIHGSGKWVEMSKKITGADLSNTDIEDFTDALQIMSLHAHASLKSGGIYSILLRQPGYSDTPKEDVSITLINSLTDHFELSRRIATTFPHSSYTPSEKGEFVSGFMDLLVFEKIGN